MELFYVKYFEFNINLYVLVYKRIYFNVIKNK